MLRVLSFLAIFALIDANLVRVKLEGNHKLNSIQNIKAERNVVQTKYQEHNAQYNAEDQVPIISYTPNSLVFGTVYVGTPPQQLTVLFDTTYPSTVLYQLLDCGSNSMNCIPTMKGFNSSASSTFDEFNDEKEGAASLPQGDFGVDVYQVGDIVIQNQFFDYFTIIEFQQHYDGVFSLSANYRYSKVAKTPILNMVEQHLLDNLIFSMYINNNDENLAGEVIFGGSDASIYNGQLKYLKSQDTNYTNLWSFNLDSISLGNNVLLNKQTKAVIDTSLNSIYLNASQYIQIIEALQGILNNDQEYEVDCNRIGQFPIVTINIADLTFNIPPQSYIQKIENNGTIICTPLFSAYPVNEYAGQIILGQLFLTTAYVEFNLTNSTVGLALLKQNNNK